MMFHRVPSVLTTMAAAAMMVSTATGSMQQYDFPCFGSRVPSSFSSNNNNGGDSWVGSFSAAGDNDFKCAPSGYGVAPAAASTMMESELSVGEIMQPHFQSAEALTIELWFTLPSEEMDTHRSSILTVGQSANGSIDPKKDALGLGCDGHDLQLVHADDGNMYLFVLDDSVTRQRCLPVPIELPHDLAQGESMLQLIVVLGQDLLSIFLNGQTVYEGIPLAFSGTLEHWNPEYHLQIFSDHIEGEDTAADAFSGYMHRLSLYDQFFTAHDAQVSFITNLESIRQGSMPKTAPPVPVTMMPNGDDNTGSGNDDNGETPQQQATNPPVVLPAMEGIPLLAALPKDDFSVNQASHDFPGMVALQGASTVNPKDTDGWWTLQAEIVYATQFGILTTTADNNAIQAGDRLELTKALENYAVEVLYTVGSEDYFNVPRVTDTGDDLGVQAEFFSYRVLAVDATTGDVLAASSIVRQEVHVIRINRPAKLVTQSEPLVWSKNNDGLVSKPRTYLHAPIMVQDPVAGMVEQVRVDVSTGGSGTISLNEEYRNLADFEGCRHRELSNWQCVGTGDEDRQMSFVAYPDDVELILKDLVYDGAYEKEDQITIRLYDGVGGECLSREEHAPMTYANGRPMEMDDSADECHEDVLVFELEAQEGISITLDFGEDGEASNKYGMVIPIVCAVAFMVPLYLVWQCLQCCRRFCCARGQEVNDGDDDSDTKDDDTSEETNDNDNNV